MKAILGLLLGPIHIYLRVFRQEAFIVCHLSEYVREASQELKMKPAAVTYALSSELQIGSYTRSPNAGGLAAVSLHLALVLGGVSIYIYMCLRTRLGKNTHTYSHTHTRTYTHSHMHTCTHAHIHTYTHTHIHTYTDTQTQTHRHTDTQTHRHTDTGCASMRFEQTRASKCGNSPRTYSKPELALLKSAPKSQT